MFVPTSGFGDSSIRILRRQGSGSQEYAGTYKVAMNSLWAGLFGGFWGAGSSKRKGVGCLFCQHI